jgi:hypothetical protein
MYQITQSLEGGMSEILQSEDAVDGMTSVQSFPKLSYHTIYVWYTQRSRSLPIHNTRNFIRSITTTNI